MAVTESNHTVSNSSTTNYSFTFPYLKTTDVKVSINGTASSAWTFHNATTVKLNSNPTVGDKIRIYRETDDSDLQATFYAGSSIKASDLNDNFTQTLYVSQESNNKIDTAWTSGDETIDSSETWVSNDLRVGTTQAIDGRIDSKIDTALTGDVVAGNRITVTDNSPSSGKITVAVTSGSLVDSDVNASAAIAGTKVSPNFGSQNVSTSGTLGAGNTTVSGNIVVTGTVDGRDVAADGTKLDGIDTGAKDDQTAAEIKTLIASSPLDSSHLATNSVDSVKLANNSVDTAALQDLNVTTAKIANDAVTRDKIATSAIGTNEIDSGSITSTLLATDSVTTNHIADAELTTLAGMQSGTASKLADSTALTADIADLNQIDGLTKQTTISDSDASFPTSGAVVDYVAAQIAPLGGLEVISNEDNFPATQPASGVVISIADAGGIVVNGSGVSTTARTAGNGSDNVTINGFPSTLYSTTLVDNMGLLVSSTGSSNTYTYHKLLGKEDDIKQLSSDINDFKARYRVGSSNPTSDNDAGDLFFNTATDKLLVRNAANNSWDEAQSVGNFYISTLSPAFDGSTTDFTITNAPTYASQVLLIINGVLQKPNAGTSAPADGFALDGSTVKLGGAPATGSTYSAVVIGSTVNIGTPSDNTVSTAIIQNLAVTGDKIATNLDLADNKKIRFGTDNDLELYHNGTHNFITNAAGKVLYFYGDDFSFKNAAADETLLSFSNGYGVNLYYDNSKKLDTNSTGVQIYGHLYIGDSSEIKIGNNDDLLIYHDGTNSWINNTTGALYLKTAASNAVLVLDNNNDTIFRAVDDGATELYYDNSKKLETTSTGATITGNFVPESNDTWALGTGSLRWSSAHITALRIYTDGQWYDNAKATFGHGEDLQIYHDGTVNEIRAVNGHLHIRSEDSIIFSKIDSDGSNAEVTAKFLEDGACELYYDAVLAFKTGSNGNYFYKHCDPYVADSFNLGHNYRWKTLYTNNAVDVSSDRNTKNTIIDSDLGLSFINQLRPVSFKKNNQGDSIHYGLIAQEVEDVIINTGKSLEEFSAISKPADKTMGLAYSEFISPLIKAVQELTTEVQTLKTKVAALEAK